MEVFRKLYPREFLRRYTSQNIRPDGRGLDRERKVVIRTGVAGNASGSAEVSLGHTRVVAGVRAELARVGEQKVVSSDEGRGEQEQETTVEVRPAAGASLFEKCGQGGLDCTAQHVAVNVDMPPLCSSRFRGGRLPDEALVAAQRINAVLRTLGADFAAPEQFAFDDRGLFAWFLHVDVVCIDYDGSVYDAAMLAVVAALQTVTLWRGTVDEETGRPVADAATARRVVLGRVPVASTFATVEGSGSDSVVVLVDPTGEEESVQDASVCVTCDSAGRVYELYKPHGSPLSHNAIRQCVRTAQRRAQQVAKYVQTTSAAAAATEASAAGEH